MSLRFRDVIFTEPTLQSENEECIPASARGYYGTSDWQPQRRTDILGLENLMYSLKTRCPLTMNPTC
ncbi:hypothetical protein O3G_MSEX008758 [Manduca sexta]|nr:hypothetical protein O3G_MSEX008758 [Manduca sexta]KAG6454557.1 hypothetical protein O3G_MSEX008758 [Manduca sexta]KAG6454558.1 hypothetical protein O3G_MSEX008758 [Manduca sexta]KAG6454559.1 hypothetical protein O3G_MSEX008758 [Manduca sexta]KAG6454560.1 hypothetical protein O3G_MSEX008758 [Manduca sexta]